MTPIRQPTAHALLCSALLLAGCHSDAQLEPTGPSVAKATSPELAEVGAQQRVTGVAFITLPDDPNESKQRFNFTAARRQDGSVSGQFGLSSEQNVGLRLNGRITCMAIEGTTARLGGIITKSSDIDFEGSPLLWTVVDRGRGGAAPPDLTTDVLIPLFPQEVEEFCAGTFDPGLTLTELERGNIQVHP